MSVFAGNPMILASVDAAGKPRLSFRGSTQVFSADQLGFWARNADGTTAASIATRWTEEAEPAGNYDPVPLPAAMSTLGDMLAQIELDIRRLNPQDPMHRRLEATCIAHDHL